MNGEDLIVFLNNLFKSYGFRKNGNNWYSETNFLKKVINLQRSNFGNYYYVNYGWILKSIQLTGMDHVGGQLSSMDESENKRISELLDLDKRINDDERQTELYNFIIPNLLEKLNSINTEEDLLNELKRRSNLNNIPLVVKKHFNLM